MTLEQHIKNLTAPTKKIDVVLDTDAYNEVDDQFAISYMLCYRDKLNVKGFCAAPFFNQLSSSPADGMEKSYNELFNLIKLAGETDLLDRIYRGSTTYLPDEKTPVESEAADFMATLANDYSPENPLYIVAIGAITNVASAILKNPKMAETPSSCGLEETQRICLTLLNLIWCRILRRLASCSAAVLPSFSSRA